MFFAVGVRLYRGDFTFDNCSLDTHRVRILHMNYICAEGFSSRSGRDVGFNFLLMVYHLIFVLPLGYIGADGFPLPSGPAVGLDFVLMVCR